MERDTTIRTYRHRKMTAGCDIPVADTEDSRRQGGESSGGSADRYALLVDDQYRAGPDKRVLGHRQTCADPECIGSHDDALTVDCVEVGVRHNEVIAVDHFRYGNDPGESPWASCSDDGLVVISKSKLWNAHAFRRSFPTCVRSAS